MPLLEILEYPDPRLRTVAEPVGVVDEPIRQLAADLLETMYAAPGIGLAATQVNVHKRVLVVDISEDQNEPVVLINPEIKLADGIETHEEGCLSVPGVYEEVKRAERIEIQALNLEGQVFHMEADGLLAVCIQHEMDHLEGKLFVDYLSELKRQRIRKKLTKSRKREAQEMPAASTRL